MIRRILRELLLGAAVAFGALVVLVALRMALDGQHGWVSALVRGTLGWWLRSDHVALAVPLLLAVALAYPLRAIRASRRRDDASLRRLAVLGAVAMMATVLAAGLRVTRARGQALAALDASPWRALASLEAEGTMLVTAGAGALFLVALWGAVGGAVARRRGGGSFALVGVVAATLIGAVTASAVVHSARALFAYDDPCGDPSAITQIRYEAVAAQGAPLASARLWLLAIAGVASAVLIVLARRDRTPPPGARALAAPAALLVAGLAAFAWTRGAAHDADHPPPLWRISERTWLGDALVTAAPPGATCSDPCDGPVLSFDARGFAMEGVPLAGEAEISSKLTSKRTLWQMVQSNKTFPGALVAAIPDEAPVGVAAPMIAAARAAGYRTISVLQHVPSPRWPTRTLGDLVYEPRVCCTPLPVATPLPDHGTWGRVLEAAPRP